MNTSELATASMSRRSLLYTAGAAAAVGSGLLAPGVAAAATDAGPNTVATYPIPDGIPTNDTFAVKVRNPGGTWQEVDVYYTRFMIIDAKSGRATLPDSSVAYFGFTGTVEVSITYTSDEIRTAYVRPLSYGITPAVHRRTGEIRFVLDRPRKVSIEVNGDRFNNLQLLAEAIDPNPPSPDDPDVLYFGPGVHTPADGKVVVPSGKTVYLAGGAVLKAPVLFQGVSGAKLLGPGMMWSLYSGSTIYVENSQDIVIDGVKSMGLNITVGQSQDVAIRNFSVFRAVTWGDGIDLFCSKNVVVDGAFIRTSDDCVAVYNHRWNYYGDSTNIVIQNSTLWADVAHPINVGTHGNSDNNETIDQLTITNIDVLDHREPQLDYQGCIALNPGDGNLIKNVRIEDVRVEDIRWGQLINMRVMFNKSYNTSVGRGIDTVYVKNLSYHGARAASSVMVGYDEDRLIQNVTFENLTVNGVLITDTGHARWYKTADYLPMYVNEHVRNLTFVGPASVSPDVPSISSPATALASFGVPFRYTIAASNNPYIFGATGLPPGLSFDTATGVLAGLPTASGTYAVTIAATNAAGSGTATLTLTVK
ncbi:putative Ig domain-containing protein [Kribbella sp. NPDC004536]|uniref:putative Ig domain-containing protein n=1 Tax=Kribbella sp. NPDC004536 TaxID=3364106 RepID=UPI0036A52BB7